PRPSASGTAWSATGSTARRRSCSKPLRLQRGPRPPPLGARRRSPGRTRTSRR
ncbi:unnamed protein product, partial [Heterosigma akashiwo]